MKYSSRTYLDKYSLMIYHQQAWCLTGYYISVIGIIPKRSPIDTAERIDQQVQAFFSLNLGNLAWSCAK